MIPHLLRCEARSRLYALRCRFWRWHRGRHSYEPVMKP